MEEEGQRSRRPLNVSSENMSLRARHHFCRWEPEGEAVSVASTDRYQKLGLSGNLPPHDGAGNFLLLALKNVL